MTSEILLLSIILLTAVLLFSLEVFPVDKVSLLVLGSLAAFQLITPEQAVSGFGNPATITVACMLALSFGIEKTGALNFVATRIVDFSGGSEVKVLVSIMVTVGVFSAFINNTAAVAIFLPLSLSVSRERQLDPSRLLMPMSFAAILAGTCTLIGTSTNLLVYGLLQERTGRAIGMFELTAPGAILFLIGAAYLIVIGRHLIPLRRAQADLTEVYHLRNFVTELILLKDSPLLGKTLEQLHLHEEHGLEVIELWRKGTKMLLAGEEIRLQEGDVLLVQADSVSLLEFQSGQGVQLKGLTLADRDLEDENIALVEVALSPNSRLVGSTLQEVDFRNTYRATTLAIRSHGRTIREKIGKTRLATGDCLLVLTSRDQLNTLRREPDFLLLEEVGYSFLKKKKASYALLIFLAVIGLAAFNVLDIVAAAIMGVALMLLFGCIRLPELYASLPWATLIMLGSLIPLGVAMENTGMAALVATSVVENLEILGPAAVLAGIYLLTSLLTEFLSNNASAVLMVPICLAVADQLQTSELPFIFAIMFAASASFMTPIGYQTNTMVFGAGGYRFADFLKVGGPLNLIAWVVASFLIPWFWPF